jgi:hypothetical protein
MGCSSSKAAKKEPIANPYARIHRQIKKEEIEENKTLKMEDLSIPESLKVNASDFEIDAYLQEGGMGKGKACSLSFVGPAMYKASVIFSTVSPTYHHTAGSFIHTVYSATRKSDKKKVALKFFGYTKRLATPEDIQHEIDLMSALKGVEGFIQTEGVFWDSEEGIIPESKHHRVACPVIVMELMEGVSHCVTWWMMSGE